MKKGFNKKERNFSIVQLLCYVSSVVKKLIVLLSLVMPYPFVGETESNCAKFKRLTLAISLQLHETSCVRVYYKKVDAFYFTIHFDYI